MKLKNYQEKLYQMGRSKENNKKIHKLINQLIIISLTNKDS